MRPRILAVFGLLFLGMLLTPPQASAEFDLGKSIDKLARGAVNIATGWVEIPKRIYETSETSGAATGWTWGLIRGLGYGFVRTAAGFYEFLTFPFPAPPDYAPVMQPEYVFVDETPPVEQRPVRQDPRLPRSRSSQ